MADLHFLPDRNPSADHLVNELRDLIARFDEPHPLLKVDDALHYGLLIRERFKELDQYLTKNGTFPRTWITGENRVEHF